MAKSKKLKIFISHIAEESELAKALKENLEKAFPDKLNIFVSSDDTSLSLGKMWLQSIEAFLKQADLVIILCSKASIGRPWINIELGAGWIRGIPVIPICHSGLKIDELPFELTARMSVQANDKKNIKKLYQDISASLGNTAARQDPDIFVRFVRQFENKKTKAGQAKKKERKQLFSGLQIIHQDGVKKRPLPKNSPFWRKTDFGTQWSTDRDSSKKWISQKIKSAEREVCIICYSFIAYKDNFQQEIRHFLEKDGVKLRVLMLNPDYRGFYEKTALEAFKFGIGTDFEKWAMDHESTIENHKEDIKVSATHLAGWRKRFGADKVEFAFYEDTPNLYGLMFDKTALCLSSYFFDPFSRGFENPALLADDISSHPNLIFLQRVFWQWFEVKMAFGKFFETTA